MEGHYFQDCTSSKRYNYNYDINSNNLEYSRCCSNGYSCSCRCRQNRCNRELCDSDFKIRLAGLQGGLMFRLRQLLGCKAEVELDNGTKINGTFIFVGSNFVEILVEETLPPNGDAVEEEIEEHDEILELEVTCKQNLLDEKIASDEENELMEYEKGRTWIFSSDKIVHVVIDSSCQKYKSNKSSS